MSNTQPHEQPVASLNGASTNGTVNVPILDFDNIADPLFGELTKKLSLPNIEDALKQQIFSYVKEVYKMNSEREDARTREEIDHELAMYLFKVWQFFYSRDYRVAELASSQVLNAIATKKTHFPFGIPKLILCIDGRVLAKLVACLHGSTLRMPAGDTSELLPRKRGTGFYLAPKGQIARSIDSTLGGQDFICEVLDSHIACAARELIAVKHSCGSDIHDKGLREDVIRKTSLGQSILDYVSKKHGSNKKAMVIQISFDPHNGQIYMGLEKKDCLYDKRVLDKGYNDQVLAELVKESKILSTKEMVSSNDALRTIFTEYYFDADYKKKYAQSTSQFWINMTLFRGQALPLIRQKLEEVFDFKDVNEDEIAQRAQLLLANAYNMFLLNYDKDGNWVAKKYEYDEHNESVMVITYSEKGPFDRAEAFSIDPNNPNLSSDLDLGQRIIRNNREMKRMSGTETQAVETLYHENPRSYMRNAVPVFIFGRVAGITKDQIDILQSTDWSDVANMNWHGMSEKDFKCFLQEKYPMIPSVIVDQIEGLRKRCIELYTPGEDATESFLTGKLIPIPSICSSDRKTICLIPFITKGYEEENHC